MEYLNIVSPSSPLLQLETEVSRWSREGKVDKETGDKREAGWWGREHKENTFMRLFFIIKTHKYVIFMNKKP